jgi:hypothetical protein
MPYFLIQCLASFFNACRFGTYDPYYIGITNIQNMEMVGEEWELG